MVGHGVIVPPPVVTVATDGSGAYNCDGDSDQEQINEALEPSEQAVAMAGRCLPEGHPTRTSWEQSLAIIRKNLDGG